jgi:hypothetical protein
MVAMTGTSFDTTANSTASIPSAVRHRDDRHDRLNALLWHSRRVVQETCWHAVLSDGLQPGQRWSLLKKCAQDHPFWKPLVEYLFRASFDLFQGFPPTNAHVTVTEYEHRAGSTLAADFCVDTLESGLELSKTVCDELARIVATFAAFHETSDVAVRTISWLSALKNLRKPSPSKRRSPPAAVADVARSCFWKDRFVAPLGMLVLSHHLGATYTRFLELARSRGMALRAAEQEVLGVDHRQLACAIYAIWSSASLTNEQTLRQRATKDQSHHGTSSQPITTCELLKDAIDKVIDNTIDTTIDNTGDATGDKDSADEDMDVVLEDLSSTEDIPANGHPVERPERAAYRQIVAYLLDPPQAGRLLNQTSRDIGSVSPTRDDVRIAHGSAVKSTMAICSGGAASSMQARCTADKGAGVVSAGVLPDIFDLIHKAAGLCRHRRKPISLVLLEPVDGSAFQPLFVPWLQSALCSAVQAANEQSVCLNDSQMRWITVLPENDRAQAVRLAHYVQQQWEAVCKKQDFPLAAAPLAIGVATCAVVSRTLEARDLWAAAERCLESAKLLRTACVKSIDVL